MICHHVEFHTSDSLTVLLQIADFLPLYNENKKTLMPVPIMLTAYLFTFLYLTMLFFNNMRKMASGNCVGKAENACNDFHLLTFYQTTNV